MEVLQYRIIRTEAQYWDYCNRLEELVMTESEDPEVEDEIDLLTLLIEKWDDEHNTLAKSDPVEVLKFLKAEHKLKSKDLAELIDVSEGFISEVLSYKKTFSKENVWKLAEYFKVRQELFNRPYQLKTNLSLGRKNETISKAIRKLRASH